MFEDDSWYFPIAEQRRHIPPSHKRSTGAVARNEGPKDHVKKAFFRALLALEQLPATLMSMGYFVLDVCDDLMFFLLSAMDDKTLGFLLSAFLLGIYMMLLYSIPEIIPLFAIMSFVATGLFAILSIMYFSAIGIMWLASIPFNNLYFYMGLLVDLLTAVVSRNPELAHALIGTIVGLNIVILFIFLIPSLEDPSVDAIGIIAIISSPKQQPLPQRGQEDA
jgi:hypothetical protein